MQNLQEKAKELRRNTFSLAVEHNDPHIASAFSIIEILIGLYEEILKPQDRFILSKGHGCFSFYAILREKGYNPKISGHPDRDPKNGICCTTGSLGHGFPIGVGMALAKKVKKEDGKIYVLIGDGECQEGTIWESSKIACHHKLNNLTVIMDHNKLQALDKIENILSLGNLKNKFEAFGWYVSEIDGHNLKEIISALEKNAARQPHMIIAHTIKGKGLSFMENDPKWQSRFPNPDELKKAYEEI